MKKERAAQAASPFGVQRRNQVAIASFALWRAFPVNILIQATVARTLVVGPGTGCKKRAALMDVGAVIVVVRSFTLIDTGHSIAPVGPCAIRKGTDRADPQVVAAEGHDAGAELLVVRVARHA